MDLFVFIILIFFSFGPYSIIVSACASAFFENDKKFRVYANTVTVAAVAAAVVGNGGVGGSKGGSQTMKHAKCVMHLYTCRTTFSPLRCTKLQRFMHFITQSAEPAATAATVASSVRKRMLKVLSSDYFNHRIN